MSFKRLSRENLLRLSKSHVWMFANMRNTPNLLHSLNPLNNCQYQINNNILYDETVGHTSMANIVGV